MSGSAGRPRRRRWSPLPRPRFSDSPRLPGVSAGWQRLVVSLTALAMVSLFPVSAWWRRWPQRLPYRAPARFIIEQLAAGIVLASAVLIVARVLRDRITPASLARWQFPVLPLDPSALLDLSSLLVVQIAVFWAAGATVALLASRWKLAWRHAIGWAALALWIAPTIALAAAPALAPPRAGGGTRRGRRGRGLRPLRDHDSTRVSAHDAGHAADPRLRGARRAGRGRLSARQPRRPIAPSAR